MPERDMTPQTALAILHETNNTILSSQDTGKVTPDRRDQQAQSLTVGFAVSRDDLPDAWQDPVAFTVSPSDRLPRFL